MQVSAPSERTLVHVTTVPMTLLFLRGQPRWFTERGYAVHAISSSGPELQEFAASEPVRVHAVEMPRRITPLADLRALARVVSVLRRIRPDIVHAHTPKGGLLGMIAARLAGVRKRVYHVHGLPFVTRSGWRRRLLTTTEWISCTLATDVLCVSHGVARQLVEDGLCAPERARVLAGGSINGVDAQRFKPSDPSARRAARTRLGLPPEGPVGGYVGRLATEKGIRELAAAWRVVSERHPDARLLLVGPVEDNDPVPTEVLEALRRDPRVRMHGADWNTPPLYAAMDVVVLPSYREGLPVVPLEASAAGVPVISSDIPGSREAVADGISGLLVPPRDEGALAGALERYLGDPDLAARHGTEARRRAVELFSPERIRGELLEVYEGTRG